MSLLYKLDFQQISVSQESFENCCLKLAEHLRIGSIMACRCKYLKQIFTKCCYCYSLRFGVLLFGCIFLTWFIYITIGTGFMMECIFPNEYQRSLIPAPAALKATMVFSFFGIIVSAMLCLGVHNVCDLSIINIPNIFSICL